MALAAGALLSPAPAPAYPPLDNPDAEVRFEGPRTRPVPWPAGKGSEPAEQATAPRAPARTLGELFQLMDEAAATGGTVVLTVR